MRALPLFSLLLIFFIIFSASAMPVANPYNGDKIVFGGGGGFTGITVSYVLYSNGELYQQASSSGQKDVFLKKIGLKQRKKLFAKANAIYKNYSAFERPGNMTDYLEVAKSKKKAKKYSWGEAGYSPPADIKELHNLLIALIKK